MKYSIVQLREFERAAFIAGDSEKAAIIGDLIAVFEALEILTEAGDDFIRDIKRATQYSAAAGVIPPDLLAFSAEDYAYIEFLAAIEKAREITE